MKKVGIISIYDNDNYGNRLQNYAVQEVLKKINCEPETIINWAETNQQISKLVEFKKCIRKKLGNVKRTIKYLKKQQNKQRYECFVKFNKHNIKFSNKVITYNNAKKIQEKYDYIIVGSDQVWNPNFGRLSPIDLLTFSDSNKNISYAASFGVSSITKENEKKCKEALKNLKCISVREQAGKDIIRKLRIEKDVEVLIDPTMMLNDKEWSKVAIKPKQLKTDKYIINYFLGNLSDKRKKEIERVGKENNCEVINILDPKGGFYSTGPAEFLYLIKNAFLVCTDSFHSCVFSILFNRPFIIFDREDNVVSMNSRIETLLDKFKLENREYNNKTIRNEQLKIDYLECYNILERERKKTLEFLKKAIK